MCPYRIRAEVERGAEEFYTLQTELSSTTEVRLGHPPPELHLHRLKRGVNLYQV